MPISWEVHRAIETKRHTSWPSDCCQAGSSLEDAYSAPILQGLHTEKLVVHVPHCSWLYTILLTDPHNVNFWLYFSGDTQGNGQRYVHQSLLQTVCGWRSGGGL